MMRFIRWLLGWLGLISSNGRGGERRRRDAITSKTITTLLIYPSSTDDLVLNETVQVDSDKYFLTAPWTVDGEKVDQAVRFAETWLAEALGVRIPWQPVLTVNSHRSVSEWRSGKIYLIKDEVELLGLS